MICGMYYFVLCKEPCLAFDVVAEVNDVPMK